MYKLGIDIGASHIGLGLYDKSKKKLIKKKYIPYKPYSKIYNKVFTQFITKKYTDLLIRKIDSFLGDNKIDYIGIGCPGKVDPEKGLFYGAKELVVGKINFKKVFAKYNCPVHVENDSNCAAVGEALNNDYNKFFMITIGTGLGLSLVRKTRKKILLASDETIDKIVKLNKKENLNENYIRSFKELSETYNKRQKKILPRDAIFEDLRHNKDILENYLSDFVEGIKRINKEVKIKHICIGGGLSLHKRHFYRRLHEDLSKHEIFIAKNFNDSGIIGAVHLPIKRF